MAVAATDRLRIARLARAVTRACAFAATLVVSARVSADVTVESTGEVSVYADTTDVTVVTPTARVGARDDFAGWNAGARYLVDVVSAASVDILSTASPRWSEVRHAVSGNGEYTVGDLRVGGSAAMSVEPDYLALGGGVSSSLSLDDDHVTLAGGYSYGHDTIGRAGTAFSVFHRTLQRHAFNGGASFVLGPSSSLWLGGDVILERGDPSKPYRYVPVFDEATASRIVRGESIETVNELRLDARPLEQLPLARDRYALTARWMHRSSWATFRLEERLYGDTWSQFASTTDVRYAMDVTPRFTLAPDVRVHKQGGVSFWQRAYVATARDGEIVVPALRTGDRELGPLWSFTFGLGARVALTNRFERRRLALVARVAGIRTLFEDTLFVRSRSALFTAIGFEGTLE